MATPGTKETPLNPTQSSLDLARKMSFLVTPKVRNVLVPGVKITQNLFVDLDSSCPSELSITFNDGDTLSQRLALNLFQNESYINLTREQKYIIAILDSILKNQGFSTMHTGARLFFNFQNGTFTYNSGQAHELKIPDYEKKQVLKNTKDQCFVLLEEYAKTVSIVDVLKAYQEDPSLGGRRKFIEKNRDEFIRIFNEKLKAKNREKTNGKDNTLTLVAPFFNYWGRPEQNLAYIETFLELKKDTCDALESSPVGPPPVAAPEPEPEPEPEPATPAPAERNPPPAPEEEAAKEPETPRFSPEEKEDGRENLTKKLDQLKAALHGKQANELWYNDDSNALTPYGFSSEEVDLGGVDTLQTFKEFVEKKKQEFSDKTDKTDEEDKKIFKTLEELEKQLELIVQFQEKIPAISSSSARLATNAQAIVSNNNKFDKIAFKVTTEMLPAVKEALVKLQAEDQYFDLGQESYKSLLSPDARSFVRTLYVHDSQNVFQFRLDEVEAILEDTKRYADSLEDLKETLGDGREQDLFFVQLVYQENAPKKMAYSPDPDTHYNLLKWDATGQLTFQGKVKIHPHEQKFQVRIKFTTLNELETTLMDESDQVQEQFEFFTKLDSRAFANKIQWGASREAFFLDGKDLSAGPEYLFQETWRPLVKGDVKYRVYFGKGDQYVDLEDFASSTQVDKDLEQFLNAQNAPAGPSAQPGEVTAPPDGAALESESAEVNLQAQLDAYKTALKNQGADIWYRVNSYSRFENKTTQDIDLDGSDFTTFLEKVTQASASASDEALLTLKTQLTAIAAFLEAIGVCAAAIGEAQLSVKLLEEGDSVNLKDQYEEAQEQYDLAIKAIDELKSKGQIFETIYRYSPTYDYAGDLLSKEAREFVRIFFSSKFFENTDHPFSLALLNMKRVLEEKKHEVEAALASEEAARGPNLENEGGLQAAFIKLGEDINEAKVKGWFDEDEARTIIAYAPYNTHDTLADQARDYESMKNKFRLLAQIGQYRKTLADLELKYGESQMGEVISLKSAERSPEGGVSVKNPNIQPIAPPGYQFLTENRTVLFEEMKEKIGQGSEKERQIIERLRGLKKDLIRQINDPENKFLTVEKKAAIIKTLETLPY